MPSARRPPPTFAVRSYHPSDQASWLRCRALSFLSTQNYDNVRPRRTILTQPAIALVAVVPDDGTVIGVLDIEFHGGTATIDTIATTLTTRASE